MEQTTKRVYIELADGRTYSVSAHDVAHDRAKYYADLDDTSSYEKEYKFTAEDGFELTDWLFGNMNWWEMSPKLEKHELEPLSSAEIIETRVK